jgi:hypothetical protein
MLDVRFDSTRAYFQRRPKTSADFHCACSESRNLGHCVSADVHQYPVVANQSWGYRSRHKVRYPQMLSGTVIRSAKPRRDRITSWTVLEYAIRESRSSHTSYTHAHHRIHRYTFASWNAAETGKSCPLGSFQLTSGPDRLNGSQKLSRRSDCCFGARSPSFRRCAVVSEAVRDSRRSRVSVVLQ